MFCRADRTGVASRLQTRHLRVRRLGLRVSGRYLATPEVGQRGRRRPDGRYREKGCLRMKSGPRSESESNGQSVLRCFYFKVCGLRAEQFRTVSISSIARVSLAIARLKVKTRRSREDYVLSRATYRSYEEIPMGLKMRWSAGSGGRWQSSVRHVAFNKKKEYL